MERAGQISAQNAAKVTNYWNKRRLKLDAKRQQAIRMNEVRRSKAKHAPSSGHSDTSMTSAPAPISSQPPAPAPVAAPAPLPPSMSMYQPPTLPPMNMPISMQMSGSLMPSMDVMMTSMSGMRSYH